MSARLVEHVSGFSVAAEGERRGGCGGEKYAEEEEGGEEEEVLSGKSWSSGGFGEKL